MILDLIKVPIDINNLKLDLNSIKDYCLLYQSTNTGRTKSNIGGWQSKDLQGKHLSLNDLFIEITKKSNEYAKNIGLKDDLSLDNIWININEYKDSNIEHSHPNCILSGVFYVDCSKETGQIYFLHPSAETMQYDWEDKNIIIFNEYTGAEKTILPNAGDLIIFPSWLKHGVKPNMSENKKRISISFNMRHK